MKTENEIKEKNKITKCSKCGHEMKMMRIIFQDSERVEHYFVCQNRDCQYFIKYLFLRPSK
jgi:ssDNA-binding Zn-finger/Zn-ribbon topoisomerase 1